MDHMKTHTGSRYGRLTVIAITDAHDKWLCRCDCGVEKVRDGRSLRNGATRSCGCLQRESVVRKNTSHGLSRTSTYRIWAGMIQRCHNPHCRCYARYGGRGIIVCAAWRNSYESFLADMGERPPGLTLDRIGNSSGYEPGNCRWATLAQQARNTRQNRMLTLHGETLCMKDWADRLGVDITTIRGRLKAGWTTEDALTRPSSRLPLL